MLSNQKSASQLRERQRQREKSLSIWCTGGGCVVMAAAIGSGVIAAVTSCGG